MKKELYLFFLLYLGTITCMYAQHTFFTITRSVRGEWPSYTSPKPDEFLTVDQALKVYAFVKDSTGMEFNYSYAGCEKRAHAVSLLLKSRHIPHRKIWNIEPGTMNFVVARHVLNVTDRSGLNGNVSWPYHVAIKLFIKGPSKLDTVVVDPAIANTLINYKQWLAMQNVSDSYYTFLDPEWYSYYTINQENVYGVQMPSKMDWTFTGDYFKYSGRSLQEHWVEQALAVNKVAVVMINDKVTGPGAADMAKVNAYRKLIGNFDDVTAALQGRIPDYFQNYAADIAPYQQQYQQEFQRWVTELRPLE